MWMEIGITLATLMIMYWIFARRMFQLQVSIREGLQVESVPLEEGMTAEQEVVANAGVGGAAEEEGEAEVGAEEEGEEEGAEEDE